MAGSVLLIRNQQFVGSQLSIGNHALVLGHEGCPFAFLEVVEVDAHHLAHRSIRVSEAEDARTDIPNGIELVLDVVVHQHIVGTRTAQVLHIKVVAVAFTFHEHHICLVVAHAHAIETEREFRVHVFQTVGRLWSSDFMVIYFLELVFGGEFLSIGRCVVSAVEETVAQPLRIGEFSPHNVVVELFSGAEVDNENLVPVASASRNHICHITAVVREVNVLQRHCSVVGESIGVKHQSGLAVE